MLLLICVLWLEPTIVAAAVDGAFLIYIDVRAEPEKILLDLSMCCFCRALSDIGCVAWWALGAALLAAFIMGAMPRWCRCILRSPWLGAGAPNDCYCTAFTGRLFDDLTVRWKSCGWVCCLVDEP